MTSSNGHHRPGSKVVTERPDGALVRIHCSCGTYGAGHGSAETIDEATKEAAASYAAHVEARTRAEAKVKMRVRTALVVSAAALIGVIAVAHPFSGNIDPATDGNTSQPEDSSGGGGFNCEKGVSELMESLYGSWGSGNWPDGEYADRLRVCRQGH